VAVPAGVGGAVGAAVWVRVAVGVLVRVAVGGRAVFVLVAVGAGPDTG
jgi:hypothetical protein